MEVRLECVFIMCVIVWRVKMEVAQNSSWINKGFTGTGPSLRSSAFLVRGQLTSDQLDKRLQRGITVEKTLCGQGC